MLNRVPLVAVSVLCLAAAIPLIGQAPTATYRPNAEIERTLATRAQATPAPQMMAASVGRGDRYMINVVRRTKGQGAIAHAMGSEIHSVIDGSATLVTGGTIVRPAAGSGGIATIQGGERRTVAKGDVILVPPGTPHWYTDIQGVVTYLEIRFDVGAPTNGPAIALTASEVARVLEEKGRVAPAPLLFSAPVASGTGYQANVVRRTKPQGPASHADGTEVHHILDGGGTFVTGGKVVRQGDQSIVEGGESRQVGKGDVVLVPAGMPHWYKDLDGPITYLEVRFEVGKP